jgi:hypothetical protein
MKRPPALASWMLRHLTPGPRREDLAGDLLEELCNGRSRAWYWRQSLAAVAIANRRHARHYTLAALFAVLWSLPLPLLQFHAFRSAAFQSAFVRLIQLDWPSSALATTALEFAPVLLPLWLGLLLYLVSTTGSWHQFGRFLRGLLVSLPVFLLVTLVAATLAHQPVDMHQSTLAGILLDPSLVLVRLPFALSLFVSILAALPQPPNPTRRTAA